MTVLSLIMMDIDDFKVSNDAHGHLVGVACLQPANDTMRTLIERADVALCEAKAAGKNRTHIWTSSL